VSTDDRVSRRRYERERRARQEAETLLEERSRELFFLNRKLGEHTANLEKEVDRRTDELREALNKAETASAARARFIATMSHEIRTPLGGLLGMLELLSDQETDAQKRQLLDHALASGEALRQIVNDVLDFSRLEAGALSFQRGGVDLRKLVESVLTLTSAVHEDTEKRLECDIDPSVPQVFEGDAMRIRQVVSNLVTNAVRYSLDGQIMIRAKAHLTADTGTLRFEVEDYGIGISEEQQRHLFKDFSQIENDLTESAQGAGLGLAICKRIIEGLGGRIGVSSELKVGSTFWFELPITLVAITQLDTLCAQDTNTLPATVPTLGKRVLLAEDNAINQQVFLAFFERLGMAADVVENGLGFLRMIESERYDLAFLDIAMPEMDGLSAIRKLQSEGTADALPPFAFLTAHIVNEVQDECSALGAELVVSKPASFSDVSKAVQSLLSSGGRHLHSERASSPSTSDGSKRIAEMPAVTKLMEPEVANGLADTFSAERLRTLVDQYLDDSKGKLETFALHLSSRRFDLASQVAHSLKGASSLLGFMEISELAGILETEGEHLDDETFAEVQAGITALFDEIEQAQKSEFSSEHQCGA
jgi:signal transduction histidine kinase/DNA-binding response OmpR family regulator